MSAKETLGFIGLGMMGGPMSGRLLEAGYSLVVCDANSAALEPAIAQGAVKAETPAEVASQVETVFVSLPTPNVVEAVATGPGGLIEGKTIKRYVDLSTTGTVTAERVAKALSAKHIVTVDAPVSGGEPGARKGTLAVMCAGERQAFDHVRPALDIIGKNIFYLGETPGQGQTMKVVNNFLSATLTVASSEAMVIGVKAGLDPDTMLDVINASSGRNNATETKFPEFVLTRNFRSMKAKLLVKDLNLCREVAESAGVPAWVLSTVRQYLMQYCTQGYADEGSIGFIRLLEGMAGVEVRGKNAID